VGQLDIKTTVVASGRTIAAAGRAGLARIEDLFDLRHGGVFLVVTLTTVSISGATECPNQVSGMFADQPKL
jgi:hypothetical protein